MNILTPIKVFFCRSDVRVFLFCSLTGGALQVLSRNYLKGNPDLLNNQRITEKNDIQPKPKSFSPRGGAVIEISGTTIKIVLVKVLNFLAEHGLTAGLISGTTVVISNIPINAVSTYLRDALPQTLPHLEKDKFIVVIDGEKVDLTQCDKTLRYLFKVLEDKTIPYDERKKIAHSIITQYLDLRTARGRVRVILCIVFLIHLFYTQNNSSFVIMIENLKEAILNGKIPKKIGRAIVRRLLRKGTVVDSQLCEYVGIPREKC